MGELEFATFFRFSKLIAPFLVLQMVCFLNWQVKSFGLGAGKRICCKVLGFFLRKEHC